MIYIQIEDLKNMDGVYTTRPDAYPEADYFRIQKSDDSDKLVLIKHGGHASPVQVAINPDFTLAMLADWFLRQNFTFIPDPEPEKS